MKFVLRMPKFVENMGYEKHEKKNEISKKCDVAEAIIREMNERGIKEVNISDLGISQEGRHFVSVKIVMERDFYGSIMVMDGYYSVLAAIDKDGKKVRANEWLSMKDLDKIIRLIGEGA